MFSFLNREGESTQKSDKICCDIHKTDAAHSFYLETYTTDTGIERTPRCNYFPLVDHLACPVSKKEVGQLSRGGHHTGQDKTTSLFSQPGLSLSTLRRSAS